ncbi:molybdopterin-dependent oxidoreductase [Effusibacillus consociatus]|uniref:Molybdopterin-dependent oxidoreductase n=1 Tax=Effusibacillus consociatus TaxID=1117041 RepID=A0ABV9Q1M9_9BACL
MKKVHYRTCPLCEATCGLEIHTQNEEVLTIRGDSEDPFSRGYLCPKGYSLKEFHADPDRVKQPMIRRGTEWHVATWKEAFAEIRNQMRPIIEKYGADSVGIYLGNPNVHNLSGQLYNPMLIRAIGTRNRFSASTVDQIPKQLAAEMMFGGDFSIPIPDVDRTDYLLMIGANPLVSNGSLMTAPNMRSRIKALKNRGGRLVVIDPVRTLTAKEANEHHFIRPGTDALFLFALIHSLFEHGWVNPGRLEEHVVGLDEVRALAQDFSPEAVSASCGIPAETIRRMAREIASAPTAAVYGRMGTCTQAFGTMNSWLVDVVNILTGNLDRAGGVMFTKPAAGGNSSGQPGSKRRIRYGRFRSRVRKMPEVLGELPVVCMAEEMEVPGPGQIKAFLTIAGNPALSTPNGNRLQKALEKLEFMVSVDCYLNETTRHANVFLPAPSPLEHSHYDLAFYHLSVRNIGHYSQPVFELASDQLDEWEILLNLATALNEKDLGSDPVKALDDFAVMQMIEKEVKNPNSPIEGREPMGILAQLKAERGPERMLDFLLRVGPYGDHFGSKPDGLNLDVLKANPHGIDLGPLEPRIPEILGTPSGKIELAPDPLVEDVERLRAMLQNSPQNHMVLVGRRNLRSNNSWLHNLEPLVKGDNRCTLWIHPDDAARFGLSNGEHATVASRTGKIEVPVQITNEIMPGVISIPHGWGHNLPGIRLETAKQYAGVNSNIISDELAVDEISGNAVLNGIPVKVEKYQPEMVESVSPLIK